MLNIIEGSLPYSSSAHEDQTPRADLAFSCIYQSSIESTVSYDLRFSVDHIAYPHDDCDPFLCRTQ